MCLLDHCVVLKRGHLHLILVDLLYLMLAELRNGLHLRRQPHRTSHHLCGHRIHHVRTDDLEVPGELFGDPRPLVTKMISSGGDLR